MTEVADWFDRSAIVSTVLLAILSIGLVVSFVVLISQMRSYFREQMRKEITRLTFLFATFVFSYLLRLIYQIGLMCTLYAGWIPDEITRWQILMFLPIIWDVASIISILILHYQSFREHGKKVLDADHYTGVDHLNYGADNNTTDCDLVTLAEANGRKIVESDDEDASRECTP